MRKKDVDDVDLLILNILQKNASITNKELAEKIQLSPPPTLARVNALRQKGVIKKYAIKIDYDYLKYHIAKAAVVKFKAEDPTEALDFWKPMPWLADFQMTPKDPMTGIRTLFCRFYAPNEEDFQDSLDKIKSFKGLVDVQLFDIDFDIDAANTLICDYEPQRTTDAVKPGNK